MDELSCLQYAVCRDAPPFELVKVMVTCSVSFHNRNLLKYKLTECNFHYTDFGSLHKLSSPGYSVPPLAKHFHILYNTFPSLFSQTMLCLSQICLAKICILLCICIEVNIMSTPEGLFMLYVQDGAFPKFVFTFSYYGAVNFRSYHFPQIKLLINCLLLSLSTAYPWHFKSCECIPVSREKKFLPND